MINILMTCKRFKLTYFFSHAFFLLLVTLLVPTKVFGALDYHSSSRGVSYAPRGSEKVHMLTFTMAATAGTIDTETVQRIKVTNTGENCFFGSGIDKIYVYMDANSDGTFSPDNDTLKKTHAFTAVEKGTVSLDFDSAETVSANVRKTFFIAYDISNTAQLSETTNIFIQSISNLSESNVLLTSTITDTSTPTQNATSSTEGTIITGIEDVQVTNVAPGVVLPGNETVGMLFFKIKVAGEPILASDQDIQIIFKDTYKKFITDTSNTNGITKARLFKAKADPPFNTSVEDDVTETLSRPFSTTETNESFTDTITFTDPWTSTFEKIEEGDYYSFYLVYDIGDAISVTENSRISAQLYSIQAKGSKSKQSLTWPLQASDRQSAVESNIGGLSLVSVDSIIPENNQFGPETFSPILKFRLRANYVNVTLNTVSILNPGTLRYDLLGTKNGIKRVELYEDLNRDASLGFDSDRKIGDMFLGTTTSNNQSDLVSIPIEFTQTAPVQATIQGTSILEHNSDLGYTDSNGGNQDKDFFVVYHFGKDLIGFNGASTKQSIARLGLSTGTASYTDSSNNLSTQDIKLMTFNNETPAIASPDAVLTITDTTVDVTQATSAPFSPKTVLQGQEKVPIMALTLNSNKDIDNASFVFKNSDGRFRSDHTGISKVWVYKDVNTNEALDASDQLLAATASFTTDTPELRAAINGIPISKGSNNNYLILFDIGQNCPVGLPGIYAQLESIESNDGSSVIVGGNLPLPKVNAVISVEPKVLPTPVFTDTSTKDGSTEFTVTIQVPSNTSGKTITVTKVSPKIYLQDISGIDISPEFTITPIQDYTNTSIANKAEQSFTYNIAHSTPISGGSAVIDAYIEYTVAGFPDTTVLLTRYLSETGMTSAVETPVNLGLTKQESKYDFEFPSYIDSVTIDRHGSQLAFNNQNALSEHDKITIKIKPILGLIDESSIQVLLNGTPLSKVSLSDTGTSSSIFPLFSTSNDLTFTFDISSSTISIPDIYTGIMNNHIQVMANDFAGNPLDVTNIYYYISNAINISRFLFYPNPYPAGSAALTAGFNTSASPSTADLYIVNHVGQVIYHEQRSFTSIGYQTWAISVSNKALSPGIYIAKLIAKDTQGNTSIAKTKLAIY